MYVKLNHSSCKDDLEDINTVILKLFEFLASGKRYRIDSLKKFLGPDAGIIFTSSRKNKAVDDMLQLSREPLAERKRIYEAVKRDMEFHKNCTNPAFMFKERTLSKKQLNKVKSLMLNLYESVFQRKGFQLYGKEIGYATLCKEIFKANPLIFCPVCLALKGDFERDCEIDHYFPKAKYPGLALHPENLAPICKDCNGTGRKGVKDPLEGRSITEVYLPYQRAAKEEADIKVTGSGGKRKVELVPKAQDPTVEKRIEGLEYLYDLSKRWSPEIEYHFNIFLKLMLRFSDKTDVERMLTERAEEKRFLAEEREEVCIEAACYQFFANEGRQAFLDEWERRKNA